MTAWLILLLPLISAIIITFITRKSAVSPLISVGSVVATFILTLSILAGAVPEEGLSFTWMKIGDFQINIGLELDSLSKGMLFVVTFIGMLVHLYSLGYMKKDEGKSRYFGCLSLFMFSMTGIVLSDNFAMMFIFWELVGVSSYLLIGHWFTKDSAAEAAKKAFLTNRIGDFGFMIGILLVWGLCGSIFFEDIRGAVESVAAQHEDRLFWATLLVFMGAVGKSAQLPLHVWLPDAMEGPTPVSALIHAATMVAAGVFMLAKVSFLMGVTNAGEVIAWVGGITSLFAALCATQQNDIKRILAYSTLSQLGYMVMAVGLNHPHAGMFHLFTHAFFKALLFLGAGAAIYACHHEQDIWKMGGLFKKMKFTSIAFLVGTAALIAVPFVTSGFYSKEAVLYSAYKENVLLFVISALVALLTSFYMVRLVMVAFFGKARSEHAEHAKEVPMIMWVPLVVLAVPSVIAGFGPVAGALNPYLDGHTGHDYFPWVVFIISLLALIAGAGFAFLKYSDVESDPFNIGVFAKKFYLDEVYTEIVKIFQDGVAFVAKQLDILLIGGLGVGGGAKLASGLGNLFRKAQSGNLQGYAFIFGLGVIVVIYLAVFGN